MYPSAPHPSPLSRNELRQTLRRRRRELSKAQQAFAAQSVLRRCARHPWLRSAGRVAGYLPADGELDPTPLMRWFAARNGRVFLPRVDLRSRSLTFRAWRYGTRLRANQFGIGEPTGVTDVCASSLDVILLPLVGYDRAGNRLGMGGGFYDRTLARKTVRKGIILVGMAHSIQEVDQLPVATWDVPLDLIVNEKGLIYP